MGFYSKIQNYDELRFTVSTNIILDWGFNVSFNIMWEWGFTVTFKIMMDRVLLYYPI